MRHVTNVCSLIKAMKEIKGMMHAYGVESVPLKARWPSVAIALRKYVDHALAVTSVPLFSSKPCTEFKYLEPINRTIFVL